MRRAIADSDDEDDDVVIHCGADDDARKSGSRDVEATTYAGTTLDGTNDISTGSTEHLRRQIQSAERGLISKSSSDKMATSSAASPSLQTAKRRNTAAFGSESTPSKSVKRTKTVKTYGSSNRESRILENGAFQRLKDDAPAPLTSQSVRFSDHSHVNSSAALPSEPFPTDFVDHNPAVMFRDTGSTVADDSSTHQRLVEEALGSKKGLSTSMANDDRAAKNQSSPFPWSASEQTNSVRSTRNAESHRNAGEAAIDKSEMKDGAKQDAVLERASQRAAVDLSTEPHPSPVVEISPIGKGSATQIANNGRKRKGEQDDITDPLNSEDKAVGLPKERYKPRPSRRRATQVVEEPIDYSVRPEKAAKVKRTKTVASQPTATCESSTIKTASTIAAKAPTDRQAPEIDSHLTSTIEDDAQRKASVGSASPPRGGGTPLVDDEATATGRNIEVPATNLQLTGTASGDARNKAFVSSMRSPHVGETPVVGDDANGSTMPKPTDESLPGIEQSNEDKIFVKPAKPTPKATSAKKSKRAQTTIFEDHVEFTGSRRSPSLSQQQAKRQSASALQDVPNAGGRATQRKKKTVVVEDDGEEDDEPSTKLTEDVEDDEPPKKRGRGRPAKPTAEPQATAKENVSQYPDEVEEPPLVDDVRKKRGRGRPSKSLDEAQPEPATTGENSAASKATPSIQSTETPSIDDQALPQPIEADAVPAVSSAANIQTPSPEKSAPSKAKPKPSPNSHSPIKSSSKVPLRVGLNKRHRIPPLLRMTKPPKR